MKQRIINLLVIFAAEAFAFAFNPPQSSRPIVMAAQRSRSGGFVSVISLSMASDDLDDKGLVQKGVKAGENKDFWARQKELMQEMSDAGQKSLKEENREKFAKRRLALVGDTAYFGFFIFCFLWTCFENPFVAISYAFGATMGLAYSYGLGKYVENLGGTTDDEASLQGAGIGEARFAFLILLFIIVGKFRSAGLLEIPAISGFFTYQLASLNQGLREIQD